MRKMSYADAIDDAIAQQMSEDPRIIYLGEDVQMLRLNLFGRYGENRVINTPISESAFLGAGITAAMAGLKPVVEIMLVDFIAVAADAVLNHAAKNTFFSGNKWQVPMVIRASCGGGYGDGGQHEQSLWGWLAHIPGLQLYVPSNPADAGGLMLSAIQHEGPVVFLEHKLLAEYLRDYLGSGGRRNQDYHVPAEGEYGPVPGRWSPIPPGKANVHREGSDLSIVSLGVGLHRALEAALALQEKNISAEVIDLRTLVPMDTATLCESVSKTGRLLVVDEDYKSFGLSGEIAALLLEHSIRFQYGRICTEQVIPYTHPKELQVLPSGRSIEEAALQLVKHPRGM